MRCYKILLLYVIFIRNFRTDSQGNSFEAVSGSHEPLSVLRIEANGGNIILRAHRDEPHGGEGVVIEGFFPPQIHT